MSGAQRRAEQNENKAEMVSRAGIGAVLCSTDYGEKYPQFARLDPSGSARLSGMVHEGDFLVAVRKEVGGWFKLEGASVSEADSLLYGEPSSHVRIRVQRGDITFDCMLERTIEQAPVPSHRAGTGKSLRSSSRRDVGESPSDIHRRINNGLARFYASLEPEKQEKMSNAEFQAWKAENDLLEESREQHLACDAFAFALPCPALTEQGSTQEAPHAHAPRPLSFRTIIIGAHWQGTVRTIVGNWFWEKVCWLFGWEPWQQPDPERGGHGVGLVRRNSDDDDEDDDDDDEDDKDK